jgi:hypothetical protein
VARVYRWLVEGSTRLRRVALCGTNLKKLSATQSRGPIIDTGFLWSTPCPSTLMTPCSSLFRRLLQHPTKTGKRIDLERVSLADDVFEVLKGNAYDAYGFSLTFFHRCHRYHSINGVV